MRPTPYATGYMHGEQASEGECSVSPELASSLALSMCHAQAGAAVTKWAIEYEEPAAEAFRLNNPDATTWCANCNVILAAAMCKAGLSQCCAASPEACSAILALSRSHIC